MARTRARRAHRARGAELPASPGRSRHQLPPDDDACRGAGPAARAASGALGGQGRCTALRSARHPHRRQGRHHPGHGHDREAGRVRRARQHHHGHAAWRCLCIGRAQVVLLRADVRRFPGAGAGAGWAELLPDAPAPGRWGPERIPADAAEGQAGRRVERLRRGRVHRCACLARRRGGPGRGDHHRDGHADAPGLHAGLGGGDAHGAGAGIAPCAPSPRVRQALGRACPDAQRAGGPGAGGGGGAGVRAARGARGGRGPA